MGYVEPESSSDEDPFANCSSSSEDTGDDKTATVPEEEMYMDVGTIYMYYHCAMVCTLFRN